MKKVLVAGDSFSADQSDYSWTNNLREDFSIHNVSSNGSSEYRIYKKIKSLNLRDFDFAIITHTSPNRLYISENPLYAKCEKYNNCDLIYSDIKSKYQNEFSKNVAWWFENIFDLEQATDLHFLLVDACIKQTSIIKNIHITFFDVDIPGVHSLHEIWKKHPGQINHLNEKGNQKVASVIKKILTQR